MCEPARHDPPPVPDTTTTTTTTTAAATTEEPEIEDPTTPPPPVMVALEYSIDQMYAMVVAALVICALVLLGSLDSMFMLYSATKQGNPTNL